MGNIIVNKDIKGDICILRPVGYVDEKGGAVLVESAEGAINDGFTKLILDFAGAPVINSLGIAQLIELAEIFVDEKGGDLAFIGLSDISASVFKMVGLCMMGNIYNSEKEASDFLAD